MELSSSNVKEILILSQKKAFLIFPEMSIGHFSAQARKYFVFREQKPRKNFLYFRKRKP